MSFVKAILKLLTSDRKASVMGAALVVAVGAVFMGTRLGEGYRYPVSTLFAAIRDYPTGYHEPIERTEKVMIVVSRE